MSEENQQEERRQYTKEEMAAMRSKMTQFYTEEIKFLKKQEEYERLLADIEEHKLRGYMAIVRGAQLHAQSEAAEQEYMQQQEQGSDQDIDPTPETPAQGDDEPKKPRKLKTT